MADRLALAFALILLPTAAAAQLSAVGVSVALNHHQYADVQSLCCPPLAWATFGEGRWRLQVDYLRSYREDEGYGNYPLDDVDGWSSGVQRTNLTIDTQHHASVLVSWRALGRGRDDSSLSILFGGSYMRGKQADCFASEGPVVRIPTPADWPSGTSESVVFRQELTPEERSRCGAGVDYTRTYQWILPQVGAALDVPVWKRLFVRASMRLVLPQVEFGVGVKF